MHEWALAEAVISSVFQIAEKEGLREIREVKLRVGELQQLDIEIFEFALSQLKKGLLENASFKVEIVKAELKCRVCGHFWVFNRKALAEDSSEAVHFIPETIYAYIKCPRCGSPDFEVLSGRGVWIESIAGVK